MLGPGAGTVLFMIGGYDFMILFFGGTLIFVAVSFKFLLPASLDIHTDSEEGYDKDIINASQVSKMELVMHPNYLFALIAMGFGAIALNFYFTILSLRLIHSFGLSQSQSGIFFLIQPFTAILTATTLSLRI